MINLFIFFSFCNALVTFIVKLAREFSAALFYWDLSVSFPRLYLHCKEVTQQGFFFIKRLGGFHWFVSGSVAHRCVGFSLLRAGPLPCDPGSKGAELGVGRRCWLWGAGSGAHGPGAWAQGDLPGPRSKPVLLHRLADSVPLGHQGSPQPCSLPPRPKLVYF